VFPHPVPSAPAALQRRHAEAAAPPEPLDDDRRRDLRQQPKRLIEGRVLNLRHPASAVGHYELCLRLGFRHLPFLSVTACVRITRLPRPAGLRGAILIQPGFTFQILWEGVTFRNERHSSVNIIWHERPL